LVAITLWGGQKLFGRQRPWVDRCADPELREELDCGNESTDKNRSFYAGHPAVGMTAAGLTCVHHSHLPLYGGGAADTLACGLTVGAAVVNGFGRVVTEKHYATDLVVGFGMGAFAGFALPKLLHYDHPSSRLSETARARRALEVRASVLPMVSDDRAGMALLGVF
jgi:membrane-associated phospholipid phosphatase